MMPKENETINQDYKKKNKKPFYVITVTVLKKVTKNVIQDKRRIDYDYLHLRNGPTKEHSMRDLAHVFC